MRKLKFTFFRNLYDTHGVVKSLSWCDNIDIFLTHSVRGTPSDAQSKEALDQHKNGPAVVLGVVEGGRKSENVREINGLALDLENKSDEELSNVLEKLHPFEWVMYSTHRHGAQVIGGESRIRVILPLAAPVEISKYADTWDRLQAFVGGANDPQTKDLARLHFLPSTFDARLAISHHNTGRWLSPDDLPAGVSSHLEPLAAELDDFSIDRILLKIRNKLQRLPVSDPYKQIVTALLEGKPFAAPGERHKACLKLTFWLAFQFPPFSEQSLKYLFSKSLLAMSSQANPPTHTEIWTAYKGALAKIKDDEKKEKERAAETNLPNIKTYTKNELAAIAERQGWKTDELADRWVIQKAGTIWVLDKNGDYQGPYPKDDAPIAIQRYLTKAPIRIWTATQNGYKLRPTVEIVGEHGSLAKKIITDLGAQYTTFDPETQALRESIVPIRRQLKPTFHENIDRWLGVLGGKDAVKLRDWLSCCPDVGKQLCAIYFDGVKELGKTLFAVGVARLWTTGGPAEVSEVLSNYNEELCRCPLVFADEEIPKSFGGQSTAAKLRALLGVKERTLKRKYLAGSDLVGSLRLILAANNESLLDEIGAHTAADLEAVAQRFLYIKLPKSDFLEQFDKDELESWAQYKLAEHALWLQANHTVQTPGRRFWVEGDLTQIHQLLLTGGHWTSLVCEWLIRYILNPRPLHNDPGAGGLVRILDNELLVNEQVLCDKWRLYLKDTRQDPVTRQIGQALRAISLPDRKQLRWNRRRIRYRVVEMAHLLAWSERHGIGDASSITDRISGAIPIEQEIDASVGKVQVTEAMEY